MFANVAKIGMNVDMFFKLRSQMVKEAKKVNDTQVSNLKGPMVETNRS